MTGRDGRPANDGTAEPYGLEAHYFTEARLLQREVQIILESVNNNNFIGSIIHPNGSIAEALLREGLAKCVEWSLACVTGGPEKLREAQADAKGRKAKLWKDFVSSGPIIPAKDKEFTGKVIEIVNGDAIMVKKSKTDIKKIHLASIRPPRYVFIGIFEVYYLQTLHLISFLSPLLCFSLIKCYNHCLH